MIENKYPIFGHGQVINKEALDLLRDNPAELTDLLYLDKKDGIISGFDLVTNLEEKKVIVTRGIVKCGGKIFWMNEDYKFDMPEIENRYILKLNLFSDIEERKFYIRNADFSLEVLDIEANNSKNAGAENKITNDLEVQEEVNNERKEVWKNKIGEIEITRFITRIGAELRNDYNNFRDLRRDFNLLELINTKYSSKHKFMILPIPSASPYSTFKRSAIARASLNVSIASKSSPVYFLMPSCIVIRFHGGVKSISMPW